MDLFLIQLQKLVEISLQYLCFYFIKVVCPFLATKRTLCVVPGRLEKPLHLDWNKVTRCVHCACTHTGLKECLQKVACLLPHDGHFGRWPNSST